MPLSNTYMSSIEIFQLNFYQWCINRFYHLTSFGLNKGDNLLEGKKKKTNDSGIKWKIERERDVDGLKWRWNKYREMLIWQIYYFWVCQSTLNYFCDDTLEIEVNDVILLSVTKPSSSTSSSHKWVGSRNREEREKFFQDIVIHKMPLNRTPNWHRQQLK